METDFTPLSSLIGGGIIGLAVLILFYANGKIAGISGIVSKLIPPNLDIKNTPTSLLFICGMLLAAPIYKIVYEELPAQTISSNYLLLVFAGLIVGIGTVLGNGCTSGHGVCGISRFSMRSIIATITFMTTAFTTVFIMRHLVGV